MREFERGGAIGGDTKSPRFAMTPDPLPTKAILIVLTALAFVLLAFLGAWVLVNHLA